MFRRNGIKLASVAMTGLGMASFVSCDTESSKKWQGIWERNSSNKLNPVWHLPQISQHLYRFTDKMFPDSSEKYRILVPLCGKASDMVYLSGFGDVIGVEEADGAIEQFVRENGLSLDLEFLKQTKEKFFLLHPPEGIRQGSPIAIAKMDFLNLPNNWSEITADPSGNTLFDCAWDRVSFATVEPSQRDHYARILSDLMKDNGRVLLTVMELESETLGSEDEGAIYSISEAQVKKHFGKYFDIELLTRELTEVRDVDAQDVVYFLTKKKPRSKWLGLF